MADDVVTTEPTLTTDAVATTSVVTDPPPPPNPVDPPKPVDTPVEAPLDYSKLTLPEGHKKDDPMYGNALKLFEEQKVSPEAAQKLIDFTVTRDKEMVEAANAAAAINWNKQADGWKAEAAKKFSPEDLDGAKKLAAKMFDADTSKYLDAIRFLDHPGFIAGMVKASKAIKDDTWVSGNAAPNGSDARLHFPKSNMNP